MIGKDLVVDVVIDILGVDEQAINIEDTGADRFASWHSGHFVISKKSVNIWNYFMRTTYIIRGIKVKFEYHVLEFKDGGASGILRQPIALRCFQMFRCRFQRTYDLYDSDPNHSTRSSACRGYN